jgi:hypothetical protein
MKINDPNTVPTEKTKALLDILRKLQDVSNELDVFLYQTEPLEDLQPGEMVDIGYLCRDAATQLDEMRKKANKRKDLLGRMIFAIVTARCVAEPTLKPHMLGGLAVAEPNAINSPTVPKTGTQEYIDLCKHFGISDEAIAAGLFTPHWKHIQDYIDARFDPSKPLPEIPGITKIHPNPRCKFRKRTK